MVDRFVALSALLTGVEDLDPALAAEYIERLKGVPIGGRLEELMTLFGEIQTAGGNIEEQVRLRILEHADLGPLARDIIILWYIADVTDANGQPKTGPPEHFFRGLLWTVIRAHPPALSGGYFGHWSYPPEN